MTSKIKIRLWLNNGFKVDESKQEMAAEIRKPKTDVKTQMSLKASPVFRCLMPSGFAGTPAARDFRACEAACIAALS